MIDIELIERYASAAVAVATPRGAQAWEAEPMTDFGERTTRTSELVEELHKVIEELERLHPGRRFTPDGHLVGSLGEAAAEAMFDLVLTPPSTAGHDATTPDGRRVEIKATYGTSGVAIRSTSFDTADAFVVLRLSRIPGQRPDVVYNGPLALVAAEFGKVQSNGQAHVSLSRLRAIDVQVPHDDRVAARDSRT